MSGFACSFLATSTSRSSFLASAIALRSSSLRCSSALRFAASASFCFLASSACLRASSSALRLRSASALFASSAALRFASAMALCRAFSTSIATRRSICAFIAASRFCCWAMMPCIVFCCFCREFTTFCCSTCLPSSERRSCSPLYNRLLFCFLVAVSCWCFSVTSACFVFTSSPCARWYDAYSRMKRIRRYICEKFFAEKMNISWLCMERLRCIYLIDLTYFCFRSLSSFPSTSS